MGAPKDDTQKNEMTHSGRVAFRRHLRENLGMTHQKARETLNRLEKQWRNEGMGPAVQKAPVEDNGNPKKGGPKVTDTAPVTTNKAGGDIAAPNKGSNKVQEPEPFTGELLEDDIYLDLSDDTFYYTNIYTDGRKDPV